MLSEKVVYQMHNIQERLAEAILSGNFHVAEGIMNETDFLEFEELFISACHKSESVMYYTFILEQMKKEETVELHDLAFLLLVYPLCEVNGAFDSAYYHAERAVYMTESKEIKNLLQLLFLYTVPNPVLSDREAFDTAKQILSIDSNNQVARKLMQKAAKKLDQVVVDIKDFNQYKNA